MIHPPRPPSFTAGDPLARQGYLPAADAAARLGLGVEEVCDLARLGVLRSAHTAAGLVVQPALVRVTGVRSR